MPMYWFANKFSLTGWNLASALVAVGLVYLSNALSVETV